MPNSEGFDQPQKIESDIDNSDSSNQFFAELTQSSPSDLGSITLAPPESQTIESGNNVLEIPSLSPDKANDSTPDLTIDNGEDYGYKHPIANLAEDYEGRRPHLESTMMARVPNPGRVAQAHFASLLIKNRGMPEIGSNSGHGLASQLDEHPELFQKIDIEDRDSSDLRAGDIVFGFRQPGAGRGHSMVGIVNNRGSITWANSHRDGQVDTVSKEKFFGEGSIRRYVAYRQDLLS